MNKEIIKSKLDIYQNSDLYNVTQDKLVLKIGAKVLFTYNYNTKVGLSHNADGIVVGFKNIDDNNDNKHSTEQIILVEVENY
jgi:hypothetical protein